MCQWAPTSTGSSFILSLYLGMHGYLLHNIGVLLYPWDFHFKTLCCYLKPWKKENDCTPTLQRQQELYFCCFQREHVRGGSRGNMCTGNWIFGFSSPLFCWEQWYKPVTVWIHVVHTKCSFYIQIVYIHFTFSIQWLVLTSNSIPSNPELLHSIPSIPELFSECEVGLVAARQIYSPFPILRQDSFSVPRVIINTAYLTEEFLKKTCYLLHSPI